MKSESWQPFCLPHSSKDKNERLMPLCKVEKHWAPNNNHHRSNWARERKLRPKKGTAREMKR